MNFFTLLICQEVLSDDVFNSRFIDINIKTLNANEAKINSINNVKYINLMQLADKILDNATIVIHLKRNLSYTLHCVCWVEAKKKNWAR